MLRGPPLSEQIAYAEGELERMLRLKPGLVRSGARPIEAVDAEIELQIAVVESLKRQERALKAIPADLDAALNVKRRSKLTPTGVQN